MHEICTRSLICNSLFGSLLAISGCTVQPIVSGNNDATSNDNASEFDALSADPVTRAPFESQCSLFAGLCTGTFPTAVISVEAGPGQSVAFRQEPPGFILEGAGGENSEIVMLQGRDSALGETATTLLYSWSSGATDDDPCTLASGPEFSTLTDPAIVMQAGRHYIRLTVRNDVPLFADSLPQEFRDQCGPSAESFNFDMLELVIDVTD